MNYNEIHILQSVNTQSAILNLPANDQKPCITALLEQKAEVGFRNKGIHIISCDLLNRQMRQIPEVELMMQDYNEQLSEPLNLREVKSIVHSASKTLTNGKGRTYGCNTSEELVTDNCLGKEYCPFYIKHFSKNASRKGTVSDFLRSSKFKQLAPNRVKLYLSLIIVEEKKQLKPGQIIIVSLRALQRESGIARQTISIILQDLYFEGLIKYKKGKQHKYNKTASEIKRILPIPC